jgi:hypothetical protein
MGAELSHHCNSVSSGLWSGAHALQLVATTMRRDTVVVSIWIVLGDKQKSKNECRGLLPAPW